MDHTEQQPQIVHVAGHWSHMSQRLMRSIKRDDVTSARNTALRRLQTCNTAKMRWQPDTAACVSADIERGSTRGEYGSRPATAASGCALEIEGIICATVDQIVCFKRQRELRGISLSEHDCACRTQTTDSRSI